MAAPWSPADVGPRRLVPVLVRLAAQLGAGAAEREVNWRLTQCKGGTLAV